MSTNYDIITLDPGEKRTYNLSEGETYQNKLFDQTARGARMMVRAVSLENWTIRNLGWYGCPTDDSSDSRHLINADASGHGVLENCYAKGKLIPDDGDSEPTTCGGFRITPRHSGYIDFRHTYIEGFGNNASYADSMGETGDGNGEIVYDSCYHRDNTVSQYRIGGRYSTVKNSVAIVDDPNLERGHYPYSTSHNARGVWGRHQPDLRVENSTIYMSPNDPQTSYNAEARRDDESGASAELTIQSCYTDSNPTWSERDDTGSNRANIVVNDIREGQPTTMMLHSGGVPTSAAMAASGNREYPDPFDERATGYDTITLSANETRTYDISNGETYQNKLIDQRASGASFAIRASDKSGWTVRNIGFLGIGDRDTYGAANQHMLVSCPSGGTGRIENIWMSNIPRPDDGTSTNTPMGGIYLRPSHGGHVDVRHTYIEGMGNNASYADRPGRGSGNDGTITYENCYHRDNTVSQFRIGTSGSVVRNCIGIVNDPELRRGTYITGDSKTARGVWGWHNTGLLVEDSTIVVSPDDPQGSNTFHARMLDDSHGTQCVLTVRNCHVNADAPNLVAEGPGTATVSVSGLSYEPTAAVLQNGGVPTSPQMAAEGGREYVDPFGTGGGGTGGGGDTTTGPTSGNYWGVNPNSEGDTQRLGSIEVHDRHPFGHGPE